MLRRYDGRAGGGADRDGAASRSARRRRQGSGGLGVEWWTVDGISFAVQAWVLWTVGFRGCGKDSTRRTNCPGAHARRLARSARVLPWWGPLRPSRLAR
jgi:hypothetical protein